MSFKRMEFTQTVKKVIEVEETHKVLVFVPNERYPQDVIRYNGDGEFQFSSEGSEWVPLRINDFIGDGSDVETLSFLEGLCALIKTYSCEKVS